MTIDVEAVLEKIGVDFTPTGERYMVCCPFHHDTNPSCGIWQDGGFFLCFACGMEGRLVDFVQEYCDVPYEDASKIVQGQSTLMNIEADIERVLDRVETPLTYFSWTSFTKVFPALIPDTQGWDYVTGRGITTNSIVRFSMRWGGTSGKYHHRVILPILTPERRLLAYVGRAVRPEMRPKTRKNRSPHRTLFGLGEILLRVPNPGHLVVVEGEFDAIYLQQFGIPAVANMGTSPMTPEKILQLRRYAKRRVVLSYDADDAGTRAMYGGEKGGGQVGALSKHLPTSTVDLPDGCDPNDLSEGDIDELYGEWRIPCLTQS